MRRSLHALKTMALFLMVAAAFVALGQIKRPTTTTLFGKLVDLTCAAKGRAMMDSWHNAENNDHKTQDGIVEACASACLKSGQPAALFNGKKITAVFTCDPKPTLADYAARDVEVQGFWVGHKKDEVASFVPRKIRGKGETRWVEVDCATLHE